jgi:hypothetical protein
MATYRIWYLGSDDFAIEDGVTEQEACAKTGRKSYECRVQRIPEDIIVADGAAAG